jgi:hypothetical protein
MSARVFHGIAAEVRVRTVTTDGKQRPLPSAAQYSIVDDIIAVIAGGNRPQ